MHILLTDVVTCPRCGPEFGLIVLADRLEDRTVIDGQLGCANCREEYPIRERVADLRTRRTEGSEPPPPLPSSDAERGYRMAALLGVTGPSGPIVVDSADLRLVEEVQRHLPDANVLGVSRGLPREGAGDSMGWLLCDETLPFRSRSLGGVALASGDPISLLEEALRTLGRGARVVIDPAPSGVADELLELGAEVLLQEAMVAVASDPRAG
jgi:uncharacterized protein YbaR (Trm112 family)